jgi:uncharacterized membrane protein (DUF4010 family)
MLARVLAIVGILAPGALWAASCVLVPALLLAVPIVVWRLRQTGTEVGDGVDTYRNPTNLLAAFGFAVAYGVILWLAAWLADVVGASGMYALAFVSGLTDVDAITLSSLRLLATDAVDLRVAVTTIAVALAANLLFKTGLVFVVGGRTIGRGTALSMLPPALALGVGLAILYALA